jgi:hypothetical protein
MAAKSTRGGGRRTGIPNYNKEILLDVIERLLPTSSDDWKEVSQEYMQLSGESILRDSAEVKRQFMTKLMNKGLKPTGMKK